MRGSVLLAEASKEKLLKSQAAGAGAGAGPWGAGAVVKSVQGP